MPAKTKIEGMKELERSIKRLGQLPQRCVTKAARKGAAIAHKAARANAPVDRAELKKGIVLKGERSKTKGKKVYQITLDRNKNNIFVKVSKAGKRAYYPASQEFGFRTRGGGWTPGYQYLKKSLVNNANAVEKTTVDVLAKEVDKELSKK